jgi:hypothetical protein
MDQDQMDDPDFGAMGGYEAEIPDGCVVVYPHIKSRLFHTHTPTLRSFDAVLMYLGM